MSDVLVLRDSSTLPFSPKPEIKRPKNADWQVAVDHYSDLADIDSRLRAISEKLADRFRSTLYETKSFSDRHNIALQHEAEFWTEIFGHNPEIVSFGQKLIASGNNDAAKELQKAVAIFGDTADPALLISRIEQKFPEVAKSPEPTIEIAKRLLRTHYTADAMLLLEAVGGEVRWARKPVTLRNILILKFRDQTLQFDSEYAMNQWVIKEIAPTVVASKP